MADDAALDRIFRALADPTRRDILRRSLAQDRSVSELAENYQMSFAAVQKHVATLDRAGLVTKRRRGREQIVRADPGTLRRTARLLDDLETLWKHRTDRIVDLLTDPRKDE